jgi:hypothetical protein
MLRGGSRSACARSDQEVLLSPGDTVVFYTDGLIEYGGIGIDEGTDRLTGHLADLAELPLEDLCDGLLDRVPPGRADDDIAILALHCRPARQTSQIWSSPTYQPGFRRTARRLPSAWRWGTRVGHPRSHRRSFSAWASALCSQAGQSAVPAR